MDAQKFIGLLMPWYDRHARDLPWRHKGAAHPDPYRVWLSEIMLQQTTVPAVKPYFEKFTAKYPSVRMLADAPTEDVMRDWAGLGYYSRARNLHACAKVVANDFGGAFPRGVEGLKALPGIGDYTAGAIAAIAYGVPANVVDGNVERVVTRVCAIETPLPAAKAEIKERAAAIYFSPANTRPSDLPQAIMDLAATVCVPKTPKCVICPLMPVCEGRKAGIQDMLPKRAAKAVRPKRQGFVYWVEDKKGRVLIETRAAKGLLGGMAGLPTSGWGEGEQKHLEGFAVQSIDKAGVKHVFTHFELTLRVVRATVEKTPEGYFYADPGQAGLPSVFAKVVRLVSPA